MGFPGRACVIDAARIMARCDELARISELPDAIARIYLSPQQRAANELVQGWMREAGMETRIDAAGNLVGRYEGDKPGLPCLMLGSHLDTVRDAGKYDGPLGVISAIDCVQALGDAKRRLPFALEVVGFADEEGVRFGATLLGSRAVAGTFDVAQLERRDRDGVSMREAMKTFGLDPDGIGRAARRAEEIHAYAELHIEQGPVLEAEGIAVGVVTAINGFSRLAVRLGGVAGHAGTVPMNLRRDALAGAAECVLIVEGVGGSAASLVATVGRVEAKPGAINVIPGEASFTIDCRAPNDEVREKALARMLRDFAGVAGQRQLELRIDRLQDTPVRVCAPWLMEQMQRAVAAESMPVRRLPSGAGHDGMAIGAIADIAMLFVRCKGGISHNPAESITEADAGAAARAFLRFIENFKPRPT
jgi:allantoate deiminase